MNIIIPLCGKGERFINKGYTDPKPLIKVNNKPIIFYVLDSIATSNEDNVFIFYHTSLDLHNFSTIVLNYTKDIKNIKFIPIDTYTKGASETLYKGLQYCIQNNLINQNLPAICYDCDTFYTINTLSLFSKFITTDSLLNSGCIFYFNDTQQNPIYSYIKCDNDNLICEIKEKNKISNNANCGIYGFSNTHLLYNYSKDITEDVNSYMKGECYISCIYNKMILDQHNIKGIEISSTSITSLGTPEQVEKYISTLNDNLREKFGFLFDLDGTIVFTDDIYLNVWKTILEKYNITLDIDMFKNYIQGNNDLYVCNTLLYNVKISLEELSTLKDLLFIKYIDEIKIVPGIIDFFDNIKKSGNKIAIVTNCNRIIAEIIIKKLNFDKYIDLLIVSNECKNSKPYPDPYLKAIENLKISNNNCFIFEDSKTGLLSAKSVSPKELIAIKTNQTSYTNEEYKSLNVSRIIKDYNEITVNEFIKDKCNIEDEIKNNILYSIKKQNIFQNEPIESIIIDSSKLKGGYITDALKVTIKTLFHSYDCVLKLENKNPSFLSKMANDLGLYEREYYFYKYISSSVSIPIPKFYCLVYSEKDSDSTIGILLENLYTKGCKINLDLNIESIDTTLQVVSDCAKLHSTFWNKNCFSELKRHNDSAFQPKWKDFINERWNLFKDKWKILLSDYHITLSEYIVNNFNSIQNYLSEGNLTLCHGDIKSPNIFYLPTSANRYNPYFIDWQYIAYGKGVQDIVFFLIESFDINSIQDIAILVKNYYYLKCKEFGVKNYTLEEYNKDFIYSILYFPFFVCIWFGTLSQEDLIDKNFPFFFIQKFFNFIDIFKNDINKVLLINK